MFHSFLRTPDGTFTTFNVPGAAATEAGFINPGGTISGTYFDAHNVAHGFVRTP